MSFRPPPFLSRTPPKGGLSFFFPFSCHVLFLKPRRDHDSLDFSPLAPPLRPAFPINRGPGPPLTAPQNPRWPPASAPLFNSRTPPTTWPQNPRSFFPSLLKNAPRQRMGLAASFLDSLQLSFALRAPPASRKKSRGPNRPFLAP